MKTHELLNKLVKEFSRDLTENILPYWMHKMVDTQQGGFYGQIDGREQLHQDAPKGAVLNARILWTFSAAYSLLKDPAYLEIAKRAKTYIIDHFIDEKYGGVYWSLHADGSPLDTKKQIYAIAFTIYGLTEYAKITKDKKAIKVALSLHDTLESACLDCEYNGYFEALTRQWTPISDMRLSNKDLNVSKTTNTHLHVLEAYTNLYQVAPTTQLADELKNLISLFIEKIISKKTGHLILFFDEKWVQQDKIDSFGHDIETAWLIHRAATVLGDEQIIQEVESVIPNLVIASHEGLQASGALSYEWKHDKNGCINTERHWWVQAENVIGNLDYYQLTKESKYVAIAYDTAKYILDHLVDRESGEWYWSILANGEVNKEDDKAGFWKCPYHNGRMCLEIVKRFGNDSYNLNLKNNA